MAKKALICGVSGQDGAYLAHFLLKKGYEVVGTSRDAQISAFGNLQKLGLLDRIRLESIAPADFRSVLQVLSRIRPDEIYYLAGQSSVALSFQQPMETFESVTIGTLNFLEALRFLGEPVRFYNAASGECFGNIRQPADESFPFQPRSPYAVAKAASYWAVANYREAYNLYACSGILFNHESPLRPKRFVTRKIAAAAVRIAGGANEKLHLGRLDIRRDWGWAPEYVEAMWRMLQQKIAEDFVIATGESHSLEEFVANAFDQVHLNWKDHVTIDSSLFRPTDIEISMGNAAKAARILDWNPKIRFAQVVERLIESERTGSDFVQASGV